MGLITVPLTNTTITSAWGKSVADNINLVPEMFAGSASPLSGVGGVLTITYPTALPWTPTWAFLQVRGTGGIAQYCYLTLGALTATTLTAYIWDQRNYTLTQGWTVDLHYMVGRTRA